VLEPRRRPDEAEGLPLNRPSRVVAPALLGALVALGLGGCGTQGSAPGADGPDRCTSGDLEARYRPKVSGNGQDLGWIVLKNAGDRACTVQAYGEISYVSLSGEQVGAPSEPDSGRTPPRRVLQPGDTVESALTETSYAQFPEAECRPQPVAGWQVVLPGGATATTDPLGSWACGNTAVQQMEHTAFR
jgi:hypothetical protein